MPNYVLMTRLSMAVEQDPRGRKKVGSEWRFLRSVLDRWLTESLVP